VGGERRGKAASVRIVAADQTGLPRTPPDPPRPGVDSAPVDPSGEAYELLTMPDALRS
jgi:hypothetical protein